MTEEEAERIFVSTEARCFSATRAKELKLIDHIGDMHNALRVLQGLIAERCAVYHYEKNEQVKDSLDFLYHLLS